MIFFDFDGTIVDIWTRYYQIFCIASGITWISQPEYIQVKRKLVSDKKAAAFWKITLPNEYFTTKRLLLESETYLRSDVLLLPAKDLQDFFTQNDCRILTCRRYANTFQSELKYLGIEWLANKAIILNPDLGISKKHYLMENFSESSHIVIGDSIAEWETAFLDNIHAVLVQTGLQNPTDFPITQKHTILPSISEFIKTYMKRG